MLLNFVFKFVFRIYHFFIYHKFYIFQGLFQICIFNYYFYLFLFCCIFIINFIYLHNSFSFYLQSILYLSENNFVLFSFIVLSNLLLLLLLLLFY